MRWDWVNDDNEELQWTKQLIELRQANPALKIGNTRTMAAGRLFAFERYTECVAESIIVIINPTNEPVQQMLMVRNPKMMTNRLLDNLLSNSDELLPVRLTAASLEVTLPAKGYLVLRANTDKVNGYTTYKRVV